MTYFEQNITGEELYKKIRLALKHNMNNLRVNIGKREIYPNEEMVKMD